MQQNNKPMYLYSVEFVVKPTNFSSDFEIRHIIEDLYSDSIMSYETCKKWANAELHDKLKKFTCVVDFNYTYRRVDFVFEKIKGE